MAQWQAARPEVSSRCLTQRAEAQWDVGRWCQWHRLKNLLVFLYLITVHALLLIVISEHVLQSCHSGAILEWGELSVGIQNHSWAGKNRAGSCFCSSGLTAWKKGFGRRGGQDLISTRHCNTIRALIYFPYCWDLWRCIADPEVSTQN